MKKVLLLTLVAMMLISMLSMAACKPKADEQKPEAEQIDEPAPVDTTQAPADVTPAPEAPKAPEAPVKK